MTRSTDAGFDMNNENGKQGVRPDSFMFLPAVRARSILRILQVFVVSVADFHIGVVCLLVCLW